MIKVLAITSNPESESWLRLDREIEEIRTRLQANNVSNFEFNVGMAVQANSLLPRLRAYNPDIFHFSGHGIREGLIFETDQGKDSTLVRVEVLAQAIKLFKLKLRCVFLNACFTAKEAKVIAESVDCVIGMKAPIEDEAAKEFSSSFYEALAFGSSIGEAFEISKQQLQIVKSNSAKIPQLICLKEDPNKIIFQHQPEIFAEFVLRENGQLKCDKRENYDIKLSVRGVPRNVFSVLYQFHSSFDCQNRYEEILLGQEDNDDLFYSTEIKTFGDFTVRAMMWTFNGGIGISSRLSEALRKSYPFPLPPKIEKAIQNIEKY